VRRLVLLIAAALVLAGCGSSARKPASDATAKLARQAALAPCPANGKPAGSGKQLPDLTLSCLGGSGSVQLRKLTGTPTVLNFWATWCTDCRAEMGALQKFAKAAGGKVRVLGVNTEDLSRKAPLEFLTDAKVHFASVYDKQGDAVHALGLPGMPTTVLVRSDGTIAAIHPQPVNFAQLQGLVRQQLHVVVG
jgi:cytochrome c biogenesis protein CcmG, thiol:disulfide interchange protein DsbE